MNEAQLYKKSNALQRRDAKKVLEEFGHLIQWNGDDSVLDVGCGSGDVTIDFVLPRLPETFNRLIGVDISGEMVMCANEAYKHPRIDFKVLNISGSVDQFVREVREFDHVMSFYCLHWVQNQKKALSNIHKLLKPNGDCLIAFLAKNPIFEIYHRMSSYTKWAPYMKDVRNFISPYQFVDNPAVEFEKLLLLTGFTQFSITERDDVFLYDGVENLKNSVKAVNPFLPRLPPNSVDDFLTDYIDLTMRLNLVVKNAENTDLQFLTPYKLLIVYAKK